MHQELAEGEFIFPWVLGIIFSQLFPIRMERPIFDSHIFRDIKLLYSGLFLLLMDLQQDKFFFSTVCHI